MSKLFKVLRDPKDTRDYKFKPPAAKKVYKLRDLRKHCTPVEDQGALGSCTGQTFVGAMEYLDNLDGNYVELSRLFVYWNERFLMGTVNEDSGAYMRDGVKVLARYGVCLESLHPHDIKTFKNKPTQAAFKDAETRKAIQYARVAQTEQALLDTLTAGFPVAFGMSVFEAFMSNKVARTGVVPMPVKGEAELGGHAVLMVGFHTTKRRFLVRNSWGAQWGKKGYFWIPFDYVLNRKFASDFWVIQKTT